ncbi:22654_t:CDS:1, partial [Rhizophagus irregularis]
ARIYQHQENHVLSLEIEQFKDQYGSVDWQWLGHPISLVEG